MFLFIRNFGVGEIAVILLLALIVFGPKKLPEIGKSLGKSINEFKRSMSTDDEEKKTAETPKADVTVTPKADVTVAPSADVAAAPKETGAVDSNEEKR